ELALSTHPAETSTPSSMAMTWAAFSGGTFACAVSTIAAAFSAGPYDTLPACAPGEAGAMVTSPQHGHFRPGSAHSVVTVRNRTSMTCAHDPGAGSAPSRLPLQRRHSAGGAASFFSPGS